MNPSDPEPTPPPGSFFWTGSLLILAVILSLGVQILGAWNVSATLKKQNSELRQEMDSLMGAPARGKTIETRLQLLVDEMFILAKRETDIRKIIEKYRIERTAANTPSPPPP